MRSVLSEDAMKGSGKLVMIVGVVSLCVLIYVHLNVSLFSISYRINQKSETLNERHENYRRLKFEVEQFKTPNQLAEQIEKHSFTLDAPKEIHVIKVPVPLEASMATLEQSSYHPLSKGLFDFLGRWVKVAQAKMDSR